IRRGPNTHDRKTRLAGQLSTARASSPAREPQKVPRPNAALWPSTLLINRKKAGKKSGRPQLVCTFRCLVLPTLILHSEDFALPPPAMQPIRPKEVGVKPIPGPNFSYAPRAEAMVLSTREPHPTVAYSRA